MVRVRAWAYVRVRAWVNVWARIRVRVRTRVRVKAMVRARFRGSSETILVVTENTISIKSPKYLREHSAMHVHK